MSKEERFGIAFKILFLGESNVGKNCIVNRFANNIFDYNKYTISGAYKINKNMLIKDINKLINFEIWITPGQKKYRIMHRVLYNNTNAFILVYDITNYSSFDEIKKYWMKEIKLRAPQNSRILLILILFLILVIIIVGNKNDIQINEKVSEFEVKEFSNQNNAIFHLTSAANGNGINELFEKIGKCCINKYKLNI